MSWFEDLTNFLSGSAGDFLTGGAGAALVGNAYNRLGDVGDQALKGAENLANTSLAQTQFKPFSITSATGANFATGPNGSAIMQLSPMERAYQNMMQQQAATFGGMTPAGLPEMTQGASNYLTQAQNVLGNVGMPTADREQTIYDRIRAMQSPEEQRQQMQLENRLLGQGRLGVTTDLYGGTPEQLAQQKAIQEAQNTAAVQAMQQALAEQQQQSQIGTSLANLGAGMAQGAQGLLGGQQQLSQGAMQGSYIPQAALIDSLQPGLTSAGMAQSGQLTGAQMYGQGAMSGLEALLGASLGQANLIGNVGSGMLGGALDIKI